MTLLNGEKELLKNLTEAFGEKKAKTVIKKIKLHKSNNPKKAFSYIFAEDGSFRAVEKKKDVYEEEI